MGLPEKPIGLQMAGENINPAKKEAPRLRSIDGGESIRDKSLNLIARAVGELSRMDSEKDKRMARARVSELNGILKDVGYADLIDMIVRCEEQPALSATGDYLAGYVATLPMEQNKRFVEGVRAKLAGLDAGKADGIKKRLETAARALERKGGVEMAKVFGDLAKGTNDGAIGTKWVVNKTGKDQFEIVKAEKAVSAVRTETAGGSSLEEQIKQLSEEVEVYQFGKVGEEGTIFSVLQELRKMENLNKLNQEQSGDAKWAKAREITTRKINRVKEYRLKIKKLSELYSRKLEEFKAGGDQKYFKKGLRGALTRTWGNLTGDTYLAKLKDLGKKAQKTREASETIEEEMGKLGLK